MKIISTTFNRLRYHWLRWDTSEKLSVKVRQESYSIAKSKIHEICGKRFHPNSIAKLRMTHNPHNLGEQPCPRLMQCSLVNYTGWRRWKLYRSIGLLCTSIARSPRREKFRFPGIYACIYNRQRILFSFRWYFLFRFYFVILFCDFFFTKFFPFLLNVTLNFNSISDTLNFDSNKRQIDGIIQRLFILIKLIIVTRNNLII